MKRPADLRKGLIVYGGCVGLLALLAIVGMLLAIGAGHDEPSGEPDTMRITRADTDSNWPLTVSDVRVNCGNGHTSIFVEAGGVAYPFNGAAEAHLGDYQGRFRVERNDRAITKLDPALQQYGKLYMNDSDVLQVAIQRCRAAGQSDL